MAIKRSTTKKEMKAIGARLRDARMRAGYRQKDVAEILGVSDRTMQAYDQGEVVPWHHGPKLAELYGVPLDWIWLGDSALEKSETARLEEAVEAMAAELKALRAEVRKLSRELGRVTTPA